MKTAEMVTISIGTPTNANSSIALPLRDDLRSLFMTVLNT
jgi:hypothetical protein